MKILNKISIFLRNLFHKDIPKQIEAPKTMQKEKDDFLNSIKVDLDKKESKRKVETMVCPGDGLGIQNRIQY